MPTFYMSLSHNDVSGVRIEAYSLIPLGARDANPAFWDWPGSYYPLPTGQLEHVISLNDMGTSVDSRIYFVPERSEFRLCANAVYALGPGAVDAILEVERLGVGQFRTDVHFPGSPAFGSASACLVNTVTFGGSTKTWGYV